MIHLYQFLLHKLKINIQGGINQLLSPLAENLILLTLLVLSLNNNFYLITIIVTGVIYILMTPIFKNKAIPIFAVLYVVLSVIIPSFGFFIALPSWLILGISGLIIIIVATVIIALNNKDSS
jgi:hypothetical protein